MGSGASWKDFYRRRAKAKLCFEVGIGLAVRNALHTDHAENLRQKKIQRKVELEKEVSSAKKFKEGQKVKTSDGRVAKVIGFTNNGGVRLETIPSGKIVVFKGDALSDI